MHAAPQTQAPERDLEHLVIAPPGGEPFVAILNSCDGSEDCPSPGRFPLQGASLEGSAVLLHRFDGGIDRLNLQGSAHHDALLGQISTDGLMVMAFDVDALQDLVPGRLPVPSDVAFVQAGQPLQQIHRDKPDAEKL